MHASHWIVSPGVGMVGEKGGRRRGSKISGDRAACAISHRNPCRSSLNFRRLTILKRTNILDERSIHTATYGFDTGEFSKYGRPQRHSLTPIASTHPRLDRTRLVHGNQGALRTQRRSRARKSQDRTPSRLFLIRPTSSTQTRSLLCSSQGRNRIRTARQRTPGCIRCIRANRLWCGCKRGAAAHSCLLRTLVRMLRRTLTW